MSGDKDIKSIASLLEEVDFNNREKLKPKEIENLLKTAVIKRKEDIIELIPLIEKDGFKNTLRFLENNREKDFMEILKESSIYEMARKKYFLDLTMPLRDFLNIVEGIYKCPKCGSLKTRTVQKQTRGADEGTTEITSCVCGNTWRSS